MIIYIGETIGAFIFVFLSLAIIANVLSSNENNGINLLITSLGVGLAYIIPCIIFGEITGAHFNPVVTVATTYYGIFEKRFMIGYIISEGIGALLASVIYLILNYKRFSELNIGRNNYIKLFIVSPDDNSFFIKFLKEIIATFLFMFGMLGVTFLSKDMSAVHSYILFFLIIVGVGLAFDYTQVAINPFRDIFLRILYVILPLKRKEKISIIYIFVTIIGPIIGAMLAVMFFNYIPWEM